MNFNGTIYVIDDTLVCVYGYCGKTLKISKTFSTILRTCGANVTNHSDSEN